MSKHVLEIYIGIDHNAIIFTGKDAERLRSNINNSLHLGLSTASLLDDKGTEHVFYLNQIALTKFREEPTCKNQLSDWT